jgi:tRNA threonylcarbamoyladenosine biosynthesis protein TsaE
MTSGPQKRNRAIVARGVAATWRVARQVAARLPSGGVVALQGDLGAGKTTFVQGLARALGVTRPVTSPTFAIVSEYQGAQLRLIHFDLYRLHSPDDLLALGFQEYLERGALVALEWPDRAGDLLPPETIHVHLAPAADVHSRRIEVRYPKPAAQ